MRMTLNETGNNPVIKKIAEEMRFSKLLLAFPIALLLGLPCYFGVAALIKHQDMKINMRIKRLQEQVAANPGNEAGARAQYVLAEFYSRWLGDNDSAIKNHEKLMADFPDSSWCDDALSQLGSLYDDQREYDRALECYQKIIATYPESDLLKWAYERTADILRRRQKHDEVKELH